MAANAGTVTVDVEADTKGLQNNVGRHGKAAGSKFGGAFGSSFGRSVANLGATYLGASFLKGTVDQASDLAESVNVTGLAFGDARGKADEFAKGAADAIGMSESEARAAQAQIGNILGGYGLAAKDAEEISRNMITRAADIGSAWNAGTDEVSAAIQSALVGSTEPLRKFGVIIDQAGIKQKALEMGLIGAGDELDNQSKALAINALVMEQTDNVAGDFQNTQDGFANSTKTVTAMFEDMQAQLGQALLPVLEMLLGFMRELGPEGMKMVILIGGGILVFVKLAQAAQAFSGALNLLAANPFVLAALAIIAVGILIWKNWDTVKAFLVETWEVLKVGFAALSEWFGIVWAELGAMWDSFKSKVSDVATAVGGIVQTWLIDPVQRFVDIVTALPEIAGTAWEAVKTAIGDAAEWIKTKLGELADAADRALGPIDEILGAGAGLVGGGLNLLGFDDGGTIPGPRGAPQLVMAHGGETILPTHKMSTSAALDDLGAGGGSGGGTTIALTMHVDAGVTDPQFFERQAVEMSRVLERELGRQNAAAGRSRIPGVSG